MVANVFDENKRRIIVDVLSRDVGYSVNSRILHSVLIGWGHDITLDEVHTHLAWLKVQGYIKTEWVGEFAQVATLTRCGLDVAEGRARAEGIERKLPD